MECVLTLEVLLCAKWSMDADYSRSSSLQRIESTTIRLERRFSEIGAIVGKFGTHTTQDAAKISATGGASGMAFVSSIFMKNAEKGQRRWASIGVDEWIQAGKWWLMKV